MKETELGDGKVRSLDSSKTLVAEYTHANMSLLDHGDIIGTVTDSECENVAIIRLNHAHDISFLAWSKSATDNSFTCFTHANEVELEFFVFRYVAESCIFHDHGSLFFICNHTIVKNYELIRAVLGHILLSFKPKYLEVRFNERAGARYVLCCLKLITCEHPNLNLGVLQRAYHFRHIILQLVFNSRCSQQGQITLELGVVFLFPLLTSRLHLLNSCQLLLEILQFFFVDNFHCEKQGS